MKVEKIEGVSIMVKDVDEAAKLFGDLFETEFGSPWEALDVIHRASPLGIVLIAPATPDGAAARTLGKRGEGVHTLILKVPNVTEATAEMKSRGIRQVLAGAGREGAGGGPAFFHPKDCHGVMLELAGQE